MTFPTVTYRSANGAALPLLAPADKPRYSAETLQLEVQALRLINAAQREELQTQREELRALREALARLQPRTEQVPAD
jgi:hypothetical protein